MDEAWRLHSLCVCVPIFGLVLVELLGYYTEYKDNKYISLQMIVIIGAKIYFTHLNYCDIEHKSE